MMSLVYVFIGAVMAVSLLSPLFPYRKYPYIASALFGALAAYFFYLYVFTPHGASSVFIFDDLTFAAVEASLIAAAVLSPMYSLYNKRGSITISLIAAGVLANFVLSSTINPLIALSGWGALSVSSYALAAIPKDRESMGNSVKYAFMGGLSFQFLILALVLLYSSAFTSISPALGPFAEVVFLGASLLFVAIGFKVGVVPFHMWLPEVYGKSDAKAVSALSSMMKIGPLVLVYRLLAYASTALSPEYTRYISLLVVLGAALSIITMTWGNVAAAVQTDVQKILAYSSISQVGYMLMAITTALASIMYGSSGYLAIIGLIAFFFAYSAAKAGAFAYVSGLKDKGLDSIRGGSSSDQLGSGMFTISLLSLLGLPPLLGFWAKLFVFMASSNPAIRLFYLGPVPWYTLVGVINSVISAFYYLRILQAIYGQGGGRAELKGLRFTVVASSIIIIVGGLLVPLIY